VTIAVPESPAALAAIVALHSGELAIASSVASAALESVSGSARARLHLLRAWAAMLADRPADALEAATHASSPLTPRDQLWHATVQVGIARRTEDLASFASAWRRAREILLHVPVDLFTVLPLAELVVAAARVRESDWLR